MEEKPAWYWKEKCKDAEDSASTWQFVALWGWFLFLIAIIKIILDG